MTLKEHIYEGLPCSQILGLYDEASAAMAWRIGAPNGEILPSIDPITIIPPVDPDEPEFASKLAEQICVDLQFVLGVRADGSKSKCFSATLDHSIPVPIETALAVSPNPAATLSVFLAGNEWAIDQLQNTNLPPKHATMWSGIEETLEEMEGDTSTFCEERPVLARQLADLLGLYALDGSTGLYEAWRYRYSVSSHPTSPLLLCERRHVYETGQLAQMLSCTIHANGVLTDSVQHGVNGLQSLLDNIGEPNSFDADLKALFDGNFGESVTNQFALEQVTKDIAETQGLIKTWQRPYYLIRD